MTANRSRRISRVVVRIRAAALLFLLLLIILETVGFPGWITDCMAGRMSKKNFLIKAGGMRLDLLTGIYLKDVSVYRKGVVGPAAVECEGLRLRYHPFAGASDGLPQKYSVEFIGGTIRPEQASGQAESSGGDIMGINVMLTDVVLSDIPFRRVSAQIASTPQRTVITNIVSFLGGNYGEKGKASGWVQYDRQNGITEGRIITEFDPHLLLPLLDGIGWTYAAGLIREFEWGKDKPLVDTHFTKQANDKDSSFKSESLFSMRQQIYRGIPADSCEGVVSTLFDSTNKVVTMKHLAIAKEDQIAVGGFAYDGNTKSLTYRAVSDLDPREFLHMVGLFKMEDWKDWHIDGRTRMASRGLVDFKNGDHTSIEAHVESDGLGLGILLADECNFDVVMLASTCRIVNATGSIWGGHFDAWAHILFRDEETNTVAFGCEADDCDFTKVAAAFGCGVSNDMSGKFYIEMEGDYLMTTNALQTMKACGRMSVDDGRVFQLPVFGGLTRIMTKVIPGLDFVLRQSDASAEFTVAKGKFSSDKLMIDGGVLSIKARGSTTFKGVHDYAVQLTLMSEHSVVAKLLRAITWPISKLMEFRLKGTLKDAQWYPVNFSAELLERVGLKSNENPPN